MFNSFLYLEVVQTIIETNRDLLKEGNSLMITLLKNFIDENKIQKKINVKKIISLKEILNKTIDEIKFKFNNLEELNKIKSLQKENGKTKVTFEVNEKNQIFTFELNKLRKLDYKELNSLKIKENIIKN